MELTSRPTLGSQPFTAVLTSGELTTALPMAAARSSVPGASTATRIRCSTPSPLRTMSAARSRQTPAMASASASWATPPARCELSASTMSLVLWSPSTEMRLKLSRTASSSRPCSVPRSTAASVSRNASMVAIDGSIMPAPLAMPTTVAFPARRPRTLG